MPYWTIRDFSKGQNNEYDARTIMPNVNGEAAEAVNVENYDYIQRGAIITSPGYELFDDMGTSSKGQFIGTYNADIANRYIIAVSNDNIYYYTKKSNIILHDCDAYTGGSYGNFAGTSDAVNLANSTTRKQGAGSVEFDLTVATSADNFAVLTVAALTSVDLTGYNTAGAIRLWTTLGTLTNFTSVTLRWGSSATDYWEQTVTVAIRPDTETTKNFQASDWNYLSFDWATATTTGTPVITAVDYLQLRYNYSAGYGNQNNLLIDDIRAVKSETSFQQYNLGSWSNSNSQVNGTPFLGTSSLPYYILVADHFSSTPKRISQTGAGILDMVDVTGNPPESAYICEEMMGFLFLAGDHTVYYAANEDENNWAGGGTIGFNSRILGLKKTSNKSLIVLLEDNQSQEVVFQLDDTTLESTPIKNPFMMGTGGVSHKSTKDVYNDTLFLARDGVVYFGQNSEYSNDQFRINTLSWQVDPLIHQMNYDSQERAAGFYFDKDYGISVPIGDAFDYNNQLFVYSYKYNAWRRKTGVVAAAYTVYRENNDDELYFISATDDKIYKFVTNDYSHDGTSYTRSWKSKVWNMGTSIIRKRWHYLEIGGAMPTGSEFYVTVTVDGTEVTFRVTDTALLLDASGGYIGDDFLGESFFGGELTEDFYRFYQRIPLPKSISKGHEMQFEIWNDTEGMPHKIDFANIKYEMATEQEVPDKFINSDIVA